MSRLKRTFFSLLMLVMLLVVLVAGLEGALWLFAPMQQHEWLESVPDGHVLYRMEPLQKLDNARGNIVRINKHGFRGPDYEFQRPPGTLRIEVFGGSCAFEYFSSSDDKTWPGALEKKLRERLNMPVEVLNLALPGFNNFVGKINYLCHGRAFQPNVVIVYETYNDMGNRKFRDLETTPYRPMSSTTNRPLWMRIARMTQIGRRARVMYFTLTKRSMEGAYVMTDEKKEPDLAKPVHPNAFAWYRRNLEDFALLTRSDNVLCVLCSQAFLGSRESIQKPEIRNALEFAKDRCGMTLELLVETYERFNEIMKEVARQYDCIFFDGYNAVPHDLDHIRDSVHFFDAGSEILAEQLARTLLQDDRFMAVVRRVRAEAVEPRPSS